jgi:hypothetical protein
MSAMKKFLPLLVAIVSLFPACKHDAPIQPPPLQSQIVVHVTWQNQGVAGKKIVIVELAETTYTNAGGLAQFNVHPGHYTLRAFDIGTPGPGRPFIDLTVTAFAGEATPIDIFDCQACV